MSTASTNPHFNPSGTPEVQEIKDRTESLIAYVRENVPDGRCRALALTKLEEASMWAVKGFFVSE